MRLSLHNLSSRGVELELPLKEERARVVRLEYLTEVSGLLETGEGSYRLRPVTARELVISGGTWAFGFGTVTVDTPAVLGRSELDFVAGAQGFDGTLGFESVQAESLALDFHGPRLSGDLALERLAVEHTRGEGGQAVADHLEIRNVQLSVGGLFLRAAALAADNVRVRWASGTWAVEADRLALEEVALSLEESKMEVALARVEVPAWLSVRRDAVRAGEVAVSEVGLSIKDVGRLGGNGEREGKPREESKGGPKVDLKLLDRLNGKVDVDLTLDATVPLIGRRKATHQFRVPIRDGTLNYHRLERDLAALEDAVIDFAVRGSRLVLERDVPLIPGMNKPILTWDLSEVELALAKEQLVRLRTLPGYRLPPRDPEGKKSRFALRRAHFRNIDVALSLDAPPSPPPLEGALPGAAIEALTVRGEIHYHAERTIEPTELRAAGRGVAAAIAGWPVAGWALSSEALEVESLEEAILSFAGLKPGRLSAVLRNLALRAVELRRRPSDS